MSTLAHVLEARGIATVLVASIRGQAELARPPRALAVDFPLGRPLGKPLDPPFQHRVLGAALELLRAGAGPLLVDFPETVEAEAAPLSCTIPPLHDTGVSAVIRELRGLRPAYERTRDRAPGRTNVGRAVDPGGLEAVIGVLESLVAGVALDDAHFPGHVPHDGVLDLRAYYEEAALSLVDHVPEAGSSAAWFATQTHAGELARAAQKALADAGEPRDVWAHFVPGGFGLA